MKKEIFIICDANVIGLCRYLERTRTRFWKHVKVHFIPCYELERSCDDEALKYIAEVENMYIITEDKDFQNFERALVLPKSPKTKRKYYRKMIGSVIKWIAGILADS